MNSRLPGPEVPTWGGFSCLAWFRLTTTLNLVTEDLLSSWCTPFCLPSLLPSSPDSSHRPHPFFHPSFHRNLGRRPWDTALTSRQCRAVGLAAKSPMWKASWLTVTRPLILLGLATLPWGKVFLTFVPPGSLGGQTLSWVKAEASQTISNPPVGFPCCGDGKLLARHPVPCPPHEHLLFLFACFDTFNSFMYFVWLFVFVMGFAVLVSNLGVK